MRLVEAAAVRRLHRVTIDGDCTYGCGPWPCDTRIAAQEAVAAAREVVWANALPKPLPRPPRRRSARTRIAAVAVTAIAVGVATITAAVVGPLLAFQLALLAGAALAALVVLFVLTGPR